MIGSRVEKEKTNTQKITININGHFPVVPIKLLRTFLKVELLFQNIENAYTIILSSAESLIFLYSLRVLFLLIS